MIDICYVEEFFNSLSLKELNKYTRVCKKWQQYLIDHPEVFWFKHKIKLKSYVRPCSCLFKELFWSFCREGAIIHIRTHAYGQYTYNGDRIELLGRYNIFPFS